MPPKFQPLSRSVGVVIPDQRPLGVVGVVNPKGRNVNSFLVNPQIEEKKQRLGEKRDLGSTSEGMRNLPDVQPVGELERNYRRPVGEKVTENVQSVLKQYDPSISVDGVWGPATETAYRKYWGSYTKSVEDKAKQDALLREQEFVRQEALNAERERAHNLYMESMGYNTNPYDLPTDTLRPDRYVPVQARTIDQDASRAEMSGLSLADYYNEQQKFKRNYRYDPNTDKHVPTRALYEDKAKEIATNKKQEWNKNNVHPQWAETSTLPEEDFSKYTDEQLAAYLQSNGENMPNFSGTISALRPEDVKVWSDEDRPFSKSVKHYWDMISHPFTAMANAQGTRKEFLGIPYTDYDVRDDFLENGTNPLDFASSIVNPAQYVNAAGRLTNKLVTDPIHFVTDPLSSLGYGLSWAGTKGLDELAGEGHEFANQSFMDSARNSGFTNRALEGLGEIGDAAFVFDPAIGSYMRSFNPAAGLTARALQGTKNVLNTLPPLKSFGSADFTKGYLQGAFPSAVNRLSNKLINPATRPLSTVESQTLDDVDDLFKLLYDNNVYRGRRIHGDNISRTSLNNITSDAEKLAKMQNLTSRLHPSVVEQIMGKQNFKEFGNLFTYNPAGLSGETTKQAVMFKIGSKFPGLKVKTPTGSKLYNEGYKKGVELFSKPFIENSQVDEIATGLIPLVKYSEGREKVVEALKEGMNKLDAAEVGEILAPSGSLSTDSYMLGTNSIVKKIDKGLVKYYDYEMAPLNSMSFPHKTESSAIIEKALIKLNKEIEELGAKLGKEFPRAYFDTSKEQIIAPYILVEKVAPPTKVYAEVGWKEGSSSLSEWRYVAKDGSGLKPGEVIKNTKKTYTPRYQRNAN